MHLDRAAPPRLAPFPHALELARELRHHLARFVWGQGIPKGVEHGRGDTLDAVPVRLSRFSNHRSIEADRRHDASPSISPSSKQLKCHGETEKIHGVTKSLPSRK